MYFACGSAWLNFSVKGQGNAVLFESAFPYCDTKSPTDCVKAIQQLNPSNGQLRRIETLYAGQTKWCKAINLKVSAWDQKQCNQEDFYLQVVGYPQVIIQTKRLGNPYGRDENLIYRFIGKGDVKVVPTTH